MELGFCSPKPRFLVANTIRTSFGNFTWKHHAVYWGGGGSSKSDSIHRVNNSCCSFSWQCIKMQELWPKQNLKTFREVTTILISLFSLVSVFPNTLFSAANCGNGAYTRSTSPWNGQDGSSWAFPAVEVSDNNY